ncbi:MAG TPA: hypothetical protein VF125_10840 [Solirubrobacterales bacterium]
MDAEQLARRRAKLKRGLKSGRIPFSQVIIQPPAYAEDLQVSTLVRQLPQIGAVHTKRLLDRVGLDESRTIGDLSTDERRILVSEANLLTRRLRSSRRHSATSRSKRVKQDPARDLLREWRRLMGDEPPDPAAIERAVRIAAAEQSWRASLGTLLSENDVSKILGAGAGRVRHLQENHELIALTTSDGDERYPAFQFQDGKATPALAHAHEVLVEKGHVSPWTAASWARTAHPELNDLSPSQWTGTRRDDELLLQVAERDAHRLSQ